MLVEIDWSSPYDEKSNTSTYNEADYDVKVSFDYP